MVHVVQLLALDVLRCYVECLCLQLRLGYGELFQTELTARVSKTSTVIHGYTFIPKF